MRNSSHVAVVFLLLVSLPAVAAGGVGAQVGADPSPALDESSVAHSFAAPSSATAADAGGDVIHRVITMRQLPDRPGEVEAHVAVEVPDSVSKLEVRLDPDARIVGADGFEATGEAGTVEWTGGTDRPSVTIRMDANRSQVDEHGPDPGSTAERTDGEYVFVETGEWGVAPLPRVDLAWTADASASVTADRSVTVDGPGAAGENLVVFGDLHEHTREVRGERIRLAVLEAADPVERESAILDAMVETSDALRVGARSTDLLLAVVPGDAVDWGPDGLQYGHHDAWVADHATLDEPRNVWFHEYVHTRQSYGGVADGTATETQWLVEGQADYYAALLSYEQDRITFSEFRSFLERGQQDRYAEGVLVDPTSWDDHRTDYTRGALVWGAIDSEIRRATDGERTAADVFAEMNRLDQPITERDLLRTVERYGGDAARTAAERYTRTGAVPDAWSRTDHQSLFQGDTAVFDVGLDGGADVTVESDYREGTYADPPTLVPNETIRFPVVVENVGSEAGPYDATLAVDGDHVDVASGELAPGESTVESLSWTPEEAGSYDLRVGDDSVSVDVEPPASATVVDLAFDPRAIDPGETTTAKLTVESDADRPGEVRVRFDQSTPPKEVVAKVGPDGTATSAVDLTFEEAARYEFTYDEAEATLAVGTVAAAVDRVESVPGFGPVAVLAALAAVLVIGARRR